MAWKLRHPIPRVLPSLYNLMVACLFLASLFRGCIRPDDVKFRLTNDTLNHGQGRPIQDIRVYVGGSKAWWDVVVPGDSVGVLLRPEGETPTVSLSYKFDGRTIRWDGPEIPRGVGYAINIRIGSTGAATERHCRFPCVFP
jgi:hypothetical protein